MNAEMPLTREPYTHGFFTRSLAETDPEVAHAIGLELGRQRDKIELIASENIVSRAVLEALGPDGYLVNMARGSLVDQGAMVEMLASKALGGAALDVFEDEPHVPPALFGLDNVVLSPHQGSATRQTRDKMGALVIANLDAWFAGEPLISPVV